MKMAWTATAMMILLCVSGSLGFSVPVTSKVDPGSIPPLRRQGASRNLFESASSLYYKGKAASQQARTAIADKFTRTEEISHTEAQLLAKDRWAGIRNFVRNAGKLTVPLAQAGDSEPTSPKGNFGLDTKAAWAFAATGDSTPATMEKQYDAAMGGLSVENLAKHVMRKAKSESSLPGRTMNEQYDMIMGGMSKGRIAELQYEHARMADLNDDWVHWKRLDPSADDSV